MQLHIKKSIQNDQVEFNPKNPRMVQHKNINGTHHLNRMKEKKNSHDHLNWYRENIWQKSNNFYDQTIHQPMNRRDFPQYDKEHLWKINS